MLGSSEDKKKLKQLIERAYAQGWHVQALKSGHTMFFPADKTMPPVTVGGTMSDHRSWKNAQAQLKRSGMRFDGALGAVEMQMVPRFVLSAPDVVWMAEQWREYEPVLSFIVHPGSTQRDDGWNPDVSPALVVIVDSQESMWKDLKKLPSTLAELQSVALFSNYPRDGRYTDAVFEFSKRAHDAYVVFLDKLEELRLR